MEINTFLKENKYRIIIFTVIIVLVIAALVYFFVIRNNISISINDDKKDVCRPGYMLLDNNTCYPCPAGLYGINDKCKACPINTYSSSNASTECTPCAENSFSKEGAKICLSCSSTQFYNRADGSCKECPAGQLPTTDKTTCYTPIVF